jgi:hypothetical protein
LKTDAALCSAVTQEVSNNMSALSYDLSGLILIEQIVQKMVADQASGASSFAGGSQPWLGSAGAITAKYTLLSDLTGTQLAAAGIPNAALPGGTTTTESVSSIENRLRAVLLNLAALSH